MGKKLFWDYLNVRKSTVRDGNNKNLKYKSIVIATHVYATGPAQDLKDFLLMNNVENLMFIGHPLFYKKTLRGSGHEIYKNGELISEDYASIREISPAISYIKDVLLNIWFVLKSRRKWDLYVGSNNLNALSGLVLRKLGVVEKLIYYVIDYNPKRFSNKFLNNIYHKIDQTCVKYADETWNLSPRMEEGRKEYFGFEGGNQKVVPVGVWYDRIPRKKFEEIDPYRLVFMGHVLKKQGIQYVIEAIPEIVKTIPEFNFLIIGDGPYFEDLRKEAKKLGVEKYVNFKGYIRDHREVEELISGSALAVALYEKYDENGDLNFTYFADPMKIKVYLASGVPVLTTDTHYTAKIIREYRLGSVVSINCREIKSAILNLISPENLQEIRNNVFEYSPRFNLEKIFQEVLE